MAGDHQGRIEHLGAPLADRPDWERPEPSGVLEGIENMTFRARCCAISRCSNTPEGDVQVGDGIMPHRRHSFSKSATDAEYLADHALRERLRGRRLPGSSSLADGCRSGRECRPR